MSTCRHGYAVHRCPHPATVCNYSEEYERAKYVPPPPGAELHPKQIEWARRQGSPWADSQPEDGETPSE